MKYFLDTEFIEDGRTIELISIGIVAEDGREFYAEAAIVDWQKASQWVIDNVKPHLNLLNVWLTPEMREGILKFCDIEKHGKPEFWGYYADYDWVVFCQIFGTMMDLPKGFPMYMRDIKQLCDSLGNPKLPEQGKGEHHALADARWNKTAHEYLLSLGEKPNL